MSVKSFYQPLNHTHTPDFGGSGEDVQIVEVKEYIGDPAYGTATTQLHKVHVYTVCTAA